ncbi:MAG: hypothetical protein HYY25_13180 [Candidatus Wallbacteria bacterium]|nr:hypothetical protein [Candidatus Wallbacteria bacterium]
MATDKADKKKREQERIKKQLAVLGVMLVLVVYSNRAKIFGTGGAKKGPQTARAAGQLSGGVAPSTVASPSVAAPLPAAEASAGPATPAQTPFDIPQLTEEVKQKLIARREKRPITADEVDPRQFDKTVNPFTGFEYDRDMFANRDTGGPSTPTEKEGPRIRPQPQPRTQGEVPRAIAGYRSFGVMVLDGEKQAILKKEGRIVPYHLRDGDHLENPDEQFRVTITGDNRVILEDTEAARADERYFELGSSSGPRLSERASGGSAPARPVTTGSVPSGSEPPVVFLDEGL